MRLKVGSKWHEASVEKPIMIELADEDKKNISAMGDDGDRYACFDGGDGRTIPERRLWMDQGAKKG